MINPLPLVIGMLRRHAGLASAFVLLIALAVGIGGAITAQERAVRSGSARAADGFDLIVAAPAAQIDLLLRVVFLQEGPVGLLEGEALAAAMAEERASFVAPVALGDPFGIADYFNGDPLVGTIPALVDDLGGGIAEGRNFATRFEVVVGANAPLAVGDTFQAVHGRSSDGIEETRHGPVLTVVGRIGATGSPWDRAIIVPIEFIWSIHNLGTGHAVDDATLIGPPFDPQLMPGVPALVMKPSTLAAAYGLRSRYRAEDTMAFFPAEVLVQLYDLLGDVRVVMTALSIATLVLLIAAVLGGLLTLMQLYRQRFAVLRALGASRRYVFAVAWCFGFGLVGLGSVVGLGLAAALSAIVSTVLGRASGVALSASIGWPEVGLALAIMLVGGILALLPAALLYRRPVVDALRSGA